MSERPWRVTWERSEDGYSRGRRSANREKAVSYYGQQESQRRDSLKLWFDPGPDPELTLVLVQLPPRYRVAAADQGGA